MAITLLHSKTFKLYFHENILVHVYLRLSYNNEKKKHKKKTPLPIISKLMYRYLYIYIQIHMLREFKKSDIVSHLKQ